jgi:hypothetical protein
MTKLPHTAPPVLERRWVYTTAYHCDTSHQSNRFSRLTILKINYFKMSNQDLDKAYHRYASAKGIDTAPYDSLRDNLSAAEQVVFLARRRVVGAGVLLLLACAFLPWILDSTPRSWREDVLVRMPRNIQPYQGQNQTQAQAKSSVTIPLELTPHLSKIKDERGASAASTLPELTPEKLAKH